MLRILLTLLAVVLVAGCTGGAGRTIAVPPGTVSSSAPSDAPSSASAIPVGQSARVVRVIDGDTVDVDLAGKTGRLRLIGFDTPETVDPRKPVQCFGREALARAKELLPAGTAVTIAGDPTQDTRDQYNRRLAYLWLPDGRMFGQVMIADGFAHEYTYRVPYQHQAAFKQAQREAEQAGRGLWAATSCAGNTTQAAKSGGPQPLHTDTAPDRPVPPADAYYANCAAARAAGAAPIRIGQPGYRTPLDRDRDGVACE